VTSPAPRLFFCDLDGTLLDEDGRVHPKRMSALLELRARGTRVVLASGRLPFEMRATCELLGLHGPQITMNGALLCSPLTGDVLLQRHLPEPAVREHLRFACERDVPAVLIYPGGRRTQRLSPAVEEWYGARLPEVVKDLEQLAVSRPLKTLLLTGTDRYQEILAEAYAEFSGCGYVTSGGNDASVELLHSDANKGHAAATLARHLGVPMSETAAAGDSLNDLELLAACPVSIAMREAPRLVRGAATHVAPPRLEGGLSEAIEQLFIA
jgi:Cof subfamily protein (haloacid dehalogenase superfamily)